MLNVVVEEKGMEYYNGKYHSYITLMLTEESQPKKTHTQTNKTESHTITIKWNLMIK